MAVPCHRVESHGPQLTHIAGEAMGWIKYSHSHLDILMSMKRSAN